MLTRIMVLTDGTDAAQRALERAALCAARTTEIAVVDMVYEPMLEGYLGNHAVYEPLRNRVLAERRERAAALAASLGQRGFKAVAKAIWTPRRAEGVEEYLRSEPADLIVTTPLEGGHGGLSSGDWQLVATCSTPVLVVRGPSERQYRSIVAAVDPFHAHAKPADLDVKILATAAKLQAQTGATLTALHCFIPQEYFSPDARVAARDAEAEARNRQALDVLLRDAHVPPAAARIVLGAPHAVLQGMAERGDADLIVMGALARGRIKEWLIGSTAERVLHRTRVDVVAMSPTR